MRFAVQQWIDAAAPEQLPGAQPRGAEEGDRDQGREHRRRACSTCSNDLQQGHVSQTDESVFEVGRNVATTEGAVVFENELFQLIEYKPLTAKVHERPLLFVPPCINKYYILDLQPENSLIRYTVEQGHRIFVVSWRNPDEPLASKTWDDYIERRRDQGDRRGAGDHAAQSRSTRWASASAARILATALAVLAARGEQPARQLTLLTTLARLQRHRRARHLHRRGHRCRCAR